MEWIALNNGVSMPLLGLGLYKTTEKNEMDQAISAAWEAGYRLYDTAQMYGNEELLGDALRRGGYPREELFLTSKIDTGNMSRQSVLTSFAESLNKLKTSYLDLLLIHWPGQRRERLMEAWKALEEIYAQGNVRAIGVCNCVPRHLEWILEEGNVIPAVNQIERHPLRNEKQMLDWCQTRGIQLEAWSPLLRGNLKLPLLQELAEKYEKTPAQIVLRWNVQNRCIVIPKSVHPKRIQENIDVFDFALSEEDLTKIDALNTGYRTSRNAETFDF